MSGYLPPHGKGGSASEIYSPPYELRPADLNKADEEGAVYSLRVPDGEIPHNNTVIQLGHEGLKLAPLGFGLWGWGDVLTYGWGPSGGYDQKLSDESIHGAWQEILKLFSKVFLDTAEHYGYTDGYSEKKVGDFWIGSKAQGLERSRITFATKYFPTPWRHPWKYPDIVKHCLEGSLHRSHLDHVDIYQLHGPSHWGFWPRLETLCEGLAKAYHTGKVKAIGTCNLSVDQVKYVYSYMRKRDIPYVSNQVEFSLVRQDPWSTGLIEQCHKIGVAVIAYSPLAVGRLSGKYSAENLPRGNRNFGHVRWTKIEPIVDELLRIGEKEGKTPSAVALNWVICKGAIPIPTAKNKEQVDDLAQALGWRLSKEDEQRLDVLGLTASWDYNLLKHFQNWWWQQG